MAEIVKETITTTEESVGDTIVGDTLGDTIVASPQRDSSKPVMATQVQTAATNSQTYEYLIYFFFGVLEVLLAFRFVLKLTGASISSAFVGFIYGLTGLFVLPFEGIFRRGLSQGIETTSVMDPATIVAIIVYALFAWGVVKLIRILSGEQQRDI